MWRGCAAGCEVVVVRRSGEKIGYGVRVFLQVGELVYSARSGTGATVTN